MMLASSTFISCRENDDMDTLSLRSTENHKQDTFKRETDSMGKNGSADSTTVDPPVKSGQNWKIKNNF